MIARCRVLEARRETPTIHSVRLEKPDGFEFLPVQFCGLELFTPEGGIEYPMSLACSPTKPYLEFGARLSDSPWKRAFAALKPGDEVEIDGAYGHFVLDESRPAVMIAGGIGITPLKGMIEYATDRKLDLPIRLVYSNKTPDEIAYRAWMDELARANPNVSITHTLTQARNGGWSGRVGRIDAALLREAGHGLDDPGYYVCGKPGMVQAAIEQLASLRVPTVRILYERFHGYD